MNYFRFHSNSQNDELFCFYLQIRKSAMYISYNSLYTFVGRCAFRFLWVMEETKRSFDLSFVRKYTEIMVAAITFIMGVESYSQIYYDYITRTIRDLLFHISLQLYSQKKKLCPSNDKSQVAAENDFPLFLHSLQQNINSYASYMNDNRSGFFEIVRRPQ